MHVRRVTSPRSVSSGSLSSRYSALARTAPRRKMQRLPRRAQRHGNCVIARHGQAGDACLNVVHAFSDAPAVDVYVDGAKALGDLAFGATSGWVAVPAGEHQVQVTAAGAELETAVIDADVTLEEGAAYEVAATGLLAEIEPQVYQVNLSAIGSEDEPMARVRVVHASPDAPAVDVAVKGGDVLIEDLAFPEASDYLSVPAASYDLEVRPTGTTDVALDLPGVELEAGMVYTIYAIGQTADDTLTVLPVVATTMAPEMATRAPRQRIGPTPSGARATSTEARAPYREAASMTETTLTYRSEIAAPAADVLAWHSNPGAFERLTPPWMDVRVLDGVGGIEPGDWKRLRVGAGPIGVPWTLVHDNVRTAPASSTSRKMGRLNSGGTSTGS